MVLLEPSIRRDVYLFDTFEVDPTEHVLLGSDGPVRLAPKVFDVLLLLVQRAGTLVTKEELLACVWADANVGEGSVNRAVSSLRHALGDVSEENPYIETVPKRGYRFVVEVSTRARTGPGARSETPAGPAPGHVKDAVPFKVATALPQPASTAREPRSRLSRWRAAVGATGLLAMLLIAGTGLRSATRKPASIAVLPFVFLSPSAHGEEIGISLADRLIGSVGRSVVVRPITAVTRYGGKNRDAQAAGREMRVDAVLDSTITLENEALMISAHLLRVSDGKVLWSSRVRLRDPDSSAKDLSVGLLIALSADRSGLETPRRYTRSPEAYRLYLEARALSDLKDEGAGRLAELKVREALEIDPNFALARVALADCLNRGDFHEHHWEEAEALARRALSTDDTLGEAWASLGFAKLFHRWDWEGAEADLKRAVALSPGYATAHQWLAAGHCARGNLRAASVSIDAAMHIDPGSADILSDRGDIHFFEGLDERAISVWRRAMALGDNDARRRLNQVFSMRRRLGDLATLGLEPGMQAPRDEVELLRSAHEISRNPDWNVIDRAASAVLAREGGYALDLLEQGLQEHDLSMPYVKVDPRFESLRAETRYIGILKRMRM